MKKIILMFLLTFSIFVSAQQNYIFVSSWVNMPAQETFNKPLIFIDFWATWCVPCISSMTYTEELSKEFDSDILFLYLSEEPSGLIEEFMKKKKKTFYSISDQTGKSSNRFNIHSIPQSVILDHNGRILWKGNPTEITRKQLTRFVKNSRGKKGDRGRIRKVYELKKKINWKTYTSDSNQLKYSEVMDVTNDYSVNNNEYYFSGDIEQLISRIYNLPIAQINARLRNSAKVLMTAKSDSKEAFNNLVKAFLKDTYKIKIEIKEKAQSVFVLNESERKNYFNTDFYDFEKGDNIYLVDDMNIMIDNATLSEMATDLSKFSEFSFIYKGNNVTKYDWNIHYKFNDLTFEQLKEELGFVITKDEVKIKQIDAYN